MVIIPGEKKNCTRRRDEGAAQTGERRLGNGDSAQREGEGVKRRGREEEEGDVAILLSQYSVAVSKREFE